MSAGDCSNCGGDGFEPGSYGATRCPVCHGTGNVREVPFYENPRVMLVVIIVLLAAIGCVLVGGCWLTGGAR